MRFLILFTFILTVGAVAFGFVENESNTHPRIRRQLNPMQSPSSHANLDGFTRQGVPVVRNSYGDERHVTTSFDGRKELDHYRDFVNDPWVKTENLGQILDTRTRPELRSGSRGSFDDDIWTRRRRQPQPYNYSPTPTVATWGRVPDPWYGRHENTRARTQAAHAHAYLQVRDPVPTATYAHRQRQQQHRPQHYTSYPSSTQTRSMITNPYYVKEWEVASRGDDHVTYRLKGLPPGHHDPAPLRQMGHGDGQVLARVADLRSSTGREDPYAYYGGRRGQYSNWYQRPETRSMNRENTAGMVRQGDWVKTLDTGTHVTWRKVGNLNPAPVHSPVLKSAESVLPAVTPRTYGYRESPSLSTRTYHRDHYIPRTARETWRPVGRAGSNYPLRGSGPIYPVRSSGPHYPMMNERETAEKARLSGPNIMIQ